MIERLVTAMVVLAVAVAGCADPTERRVGRDLFEATCAACHGSDLGGGIGPAIGPGSNAATSLTDEQIRGVIEVGPGAMPSFRRLSDEQVDSLVEYVRARQRDR